MNVIENLLNQPRTVEKWMRNFGGVEQNRTGNTKKPSEPRLNAILKDKEHDSKY